MLDIAWKILATLGLVGLNAFFVAAEFAAVGARTSRLETLAANSLLARLSLQIKHKLDLYLSTCQLGITVASLGLGYVTEPAVAGLLHTPLEAMGFHGIEGGHHVLATIIALSISTVLHVVVGEVAPKNVAIFYPDKMLPLVALPLIAITVAVYPAIWALNAASNALLRLLGFKFEGMGHGSVPHTKQELRVLVRQAMESGEIDLEPGTMLNRAFGLTELKVRQIMTPRTKVDYLLVGQDIREILNKVQTSEYSRLPLCDGDLDHVIGVIHMKDLFTSLKLVPGKLRLSNEAGETFAIPDGAPGSSLHVIGSADINFRRIRRDILFVPELMTAHKLLTQFQTNAVHMAVVVDEYGATQGIVTLEDVLEQIVGDITDEHDVESDEFVLDGENFRCPGSFPLHDLYHRLKVDEATQRNTGDVDTIGGYITQTLGRWPRAGDTVPFGAYVIRVTSVEDNRAKQVLIRPVEQTTVRADGPGHV